VLVGRAVAEFGVQPGGVVEVDDVVGDVVDRFGMIGVIALPDALHLQVQKEAFHDRVVPAVALATHAADQPMIHQQLAMKLAGILAAAVAGTYRPATRAIDKVPACAARSRSMWNSASRPIWEDLSATLSRHLRTDAFLKCPCIGVDISLRARSPVGLECFRSRSSPCRRAGE
jgi:hypothetical protein